MIVSSKQANYASKTESVLNRAVCSNRNIHHTSGTPKILPKLARINNLYRKTVKKVSEPFDVPVKHVKSRTTAKRFCLALYKPTSIVNILKENLGRFFLFLNFIKAHNINK